jgi:hypothetical protein
MKKFLFPVLMLLFMAVSVSAQMDSTKVIDSKGNIKYVLKANNPNIVTRQDSLTLFVTPSQLADSLGGYMQYADTAAMLDNYINSASNGLTKDGQTVKLGGTLSEPTTIATDATNTLKITGLESGSDTDSLVVIGADGTLKRRNQESLLKSGDQLFVATTDGETNFVVSGSVTLPLYSKVWVYRNGAKLIANVDYTVAGSTVTLVPDPAEWSVAAGDKIEVQWVK